KRFCHVRLCSDRSQRHRHLVRKFHAAQKRFRTIPVLRRCKPRFLIPYPCRIFRRRNQRSVRDNKFHEIETVLLRRTRCISYIQRLVRIWLGLIDRHLQRHVGVRDIFHVPRNSLALLRQLFLELRYQRCSSLRVHFFVCRSRVVSHAVGHGGNRSQ